MFDNFVEFKPEVEKEDVVVPLEKTSPIAGRKRRSNSASAPRHEEEEEEEEKMEEEEPVATRRRLRTRNSESEKGRRYFPICVSL